MLDRVDNRDSILIEYERIRRHAAGGGNDDVFACMLASWHAGMGVLPDCFGFSPEVFSAMLAQLFPGLGVQAFYQPGRRNDSMRADEYDDVYKLLVENRAGMCESEIWMAGIVSRSCQGSDHLWQDMGLWSRDQLSALMLHNFPTLAERNINNMKWKKFIYKQLCITEGIYTCRAPSCEVCADYDNCFGPET